MKSLYVLVLPFTSAFALLPVLPLPLVVLILLLFREIILKKNNFKMELRNSDFILLVFISIVYLSFLVNIPNNSLLMKPINHLISYTLSIGFMYFTIKYIFLKNLDDIKLTKFFKLITIIVFVSALFAILEFISKNFLTFSFDPFIYRPVAQEMDALATNLLFRARSFAEEPGHFALFLEIFTPISIYYLISNKFHLVIIIIFSITVIVALLFTFSTATFIIIPISIIFVMFYYFSKNKYIFQQKKFYYIFISMSVLSISLFMILDIIGLFSFYDLIQTIILKVSDSSSSSDRLNRINEFFILLGESDVINILIGFGPAGYVNNNIQSIVSLYITLLLETGILGLTVFMIFLFFILKDILLINKPVKYYLLISYISLLLHYSIISNYWFPWLWFFIVIVSMVNKLEKEQNVHNI